MALTPKTVAAALFGAALATGVAAQAHAASAYVINEIQVTDQAGFKTYAEREGALIESFGGRFLARGGTTETIAGPQVEPRITMYVFPSMDKLNAWRNAPEQKDLIAIRDRSSHFRSYAVEGMSD